MNINKNLTMTNTITIVHCWSAPRSRSTALMYAFDSRDDCVCLDEPLYRRWLLLHGHRFDRPYKTMLFEHAKEKLSLKDRISNAVKDLTCSQKVIFVKHMAKHCRLFEFEHERELGDFAYHDDIHNAHIKHRHVLLVRDPVAIISSWSAASANHSNRTEETSLEEVGVVQLLDIYSAIVSTSSTSPPVILDSDELAANPTMTLSSLCDTLEIPYNEGDMQHWKSGPKPCDGMWAPYWYENVHKSTGWNTSDVSIISDDYIKKDVTEKKYTTIHRSLVDILRASLPAYEYLSKRSCNKFRMKGSFEVYEDERNADILCWIGPPYRGRLVPRDLARISPFDSAVQGGDAVWEGLRVYSGRILSLDRHLRRLFKSAKAMGFENTHSKEEVIEAIFQTLAANGMRDGAHMRLTLTRGEKCTSSMNPKFNVYGTTLIILPEWKPTEGATTYDNSKGVALITAANRRNPPSCVDSKIHHNNLINNILPKIQANLAGAADAIMLDLDGFVSETNATNLFIVDNGTLLTPHADHCLPGITRETVLLLAKENEIPSIERRISLAEFHSADECFTTGTMGELTPVTMIDGRMIGDGMVGPVTRKLQSIYKSLPDREGWYTLIPDFT